MKRGRNISDILAWLVFFGIFFWVLLTVVEAADAGSFIKSFIYLGVIYLAGWTMRKVEVAAGVVNELRQFKVETIKEVNQIKINRASNRPGRN